MGPGPDTRTSLSSLSEPSRPASPWNHSARSPSPVSHGSTHEPHPLRSQHPVADDADGHVGDRGLPEKPSNHGRRLRRFWKRAIVLVTVPSIITAYFLAISYSLLVEDAESNKYGHRNARWVFYSWFVVGVFGLGASKHGLAGVEAAMLQDRRWHADDAMTLLLHSGQSWSGFDGWGHLLKMSIRQRRMVAPPLWLFLAFLSLMVTIALPISGISMELYDGYVATSHPAHVMGQSPDTYTTRDWVILSDLGYPRWQSGGSLVLPGAGVAYTPPYLDRSQEDNLGDLPNSFPLYGNAQEMFLTPQAEYPVSGGDTWGLRVGYNCSVVNSASEFTILSQKKTFVSSPLDSTDSRTVLSSLNNPNASIAVLGPQDGNLAAYVEVGVQGESSYELANPSSVLEFAIWQTRFSDYIGEYPFNYTMGPGMSDAGSPWIIAENGTYLLNETFLSLDDKSDHDALYKYANLSYVHGIPGTAKNVPSPIGVRCELDGLTGVATLKPEHSSFQNFIPTAAHTVHNLYVKHFGSATFEYLSHPNDTYSGYFQSSNSPPKKVVDTFGYGYSGYLQPDKLLQSVKRGLAVEALQLMYDGIQVIQNTHPHENLTASKPGKILGPGVVPTVVPIVLFCIWTAGCLLLGFRYGFLRRWAETLDGHGFLRFGAEHAEGVLRSEKGCHEEFYKREELRDLPGLVGDSKVSEEVGHVTLVSQPDFARRNKIYN